MKKFFLKISCAILALVSVFLTTTNLANAQSDNSSKERSTLEKISSAEKSKLQRFQVDPPKESIDIPVDGKNAVIHFLAFIQKILLQVILPLVAVGCGLYIAYDLFTADGDEAKMKQAWTAVLYSIIAIITIMLSAFVISLISRLNIG